MATVTQVDVPERLRELTALHPADYEDAFSVDSDAPATGGAVEWARLVREQAPQRRRREIRGAWSALGLELEPPGTADAVLGWHLRREEPGVAVLAASSPLGIHGELVFATRPDGLLYGTFVRLTSAPARRTWALIEPAHPPAVRELLTSAAEA